MESLYHILYKNGDDWGMVQMAFFYPQKTPEVDHWDDIPWVFSSKCKIPIELVGYG